MAVFEIAVVLVLVALNGLFALSELAVVSARRSRLKALAEQGRRGANMALALAADPSKFLSTAQIGIMVIGLVAGAYSGATLSADLTQILVERGWLAYACVFAAITYLSLIIGELVPKNLALRHAETIACMVAPLMTRLARIAAPAVWLLDFSTRAVFWLLRQKPQRQSTVTEEEIKVLIAEAERAGVLEVGEHRMISGVLRLGDRRVLGLMTPRTEVDWIDSCGIARADTGTHSSYRAFSCAGGRRLARYFVRGDENARAPCRSGNRQAARSQVLRAQGPDDVRHHRRTGCARDAA